MEGIWRAYVVYGGYVYCYPSIGEHIDALQLEGIGQAIDGENGGLWMGKNVLEGHLEGNLGQLEGALQLEGSLETMN